MIRDITIGQYYPAKSVLHRLDPRTKFLGTLGFLISVFLFHTFLGYAVANSISDCYDRNIQGSGEIHVQGSESHRYDPSDHGCVQYHPDTWRSAVAFRDHQGHKEGLVLAGRMAIRLVYLVIGSSIMTLTTTPNQLTDGLERLLRPLNKIRVPVHEIAMMMSIALRFIPILLEETDKIMKAQIARGADFENGNLIQKAKNMVPLLVPLFISAFRRANDLAMAMEARCYHGGEHRTQMKPLHYEKRDYAAYGILVAYLAVGVAFRVAGL